MIIFKLLALIISAWFFLAVTATALAGFLVLTGSPGTCIDRSVDPAPEASAELQANWLSVIERVGNGETVPLSITEEQATALGADYLEREDVPVNDLKVIFCPDGTAEATGKVGYMGLNSDLLVKGTLDVSGDQPEVELESVQAGNFPDLVSEKFVDLFLDKGVLTLPITANVESVEINDGEAIIVVGP